MHNINYFSLFGLEQNFDLDVSLLKRAYQQQIKRFHPDNFVQAEQSTKLNSLQQTSLINCAYNTLLLADKRAFYLLELLGYKLDSGRTMQDFDFLEQGLKWHEKLENYAKFNDIAEIENLSSQIDKFAEDTKQDFAKVYRQKDQQNKAIVFAQRLQFLARLQSKINQVLDEIELN